MNMSTFSFEERKVFLSLISIPLCRKGDQGGDVFLASASGTPLPRGLVLIGLQGVAGSATWSRIDVVRVVGPSSLGFGLSSDKRR